MTSPRAAPRSPWSVAAVACLLFLALRLPGAESPRVRFLLPAGDAAETLRQLARQAPESVVFPPDVVRGVPTPALQGEFTTREAAERLVAGTPLFVSQDPQSGALLIGWRAGFADADQSSPVPILTP